MNEGAAERLGVRGIPGEAAAIFAALCEEEPRPVAALAEEVRAYLAHVTRSAGRGATLIDLESAEELARASLALLGAMGAATPAEERRLVQAAVRYFVIEEDALGDLGSITGFDEDIEVMNAVLRHLRRTDLLIRT